MKRNIILAISGCMIMSILTGCGDTAAGTTESKKTVVESQAPVTEQAAEVAETSEKESQTVAESETALKPETETGTHAETNSSENVIDETATVNTQENADVQAHETERETGKPIYKKQVICGDYEAYGYWSYFAEDYKVSYEEEFFDMTPLTEEEEAAIEAFAELSENEQEEQLDEFAELFHKKSDQSIRLHFSPDGSGEYFVNDYIGMGQFEEHTYPFAWKPDKKNPKDYLWQLNPIPETTPGDFYSIYSYGEGVYQLVVEKADTDRVKDGLMESGLFIKKIEDEPEIETESIDDAESEEIPETDPPQASVINEYGVNTAYIGNWESSVVAYDYGTIETDEIHGSMLLYEDGTGIFFTQEEGSFEIAWGVIEDGDCYITRDDQIKLYSGTIIAGEASVMEDRQYLYTMYQTSNVPDKTKLENYFFSK